MRNAHAPSWSKYAIGKHERNQLATQTVAMAATLGFDLPEEAVRGVELREQGDALCIELEGGPISGREGRIYFQYPMTDRKTQDDPVMLKPEIGHRLLEFLHEQRWRQERKRAIAELTTQECLEHEDGDTLTRWSRAMKLHNPARIRKLEINAALCREISHDCAVSLNTAAGRVRMEGNVIVLPFALPDVMAGAAFRRIGTLLEFPPCGKADLDTEIADLTISELESANTTQSVAAHTTIKLFSQKQAPLEPGPASAWRTLRAIRPFMMGKAPEYIVPDLVAGAVAYHAECNEALGYATALPIRLEKAEQE